VAVTMPKSGKADVIEVKKSDCEKVQKVVNEKINEFLRMDYPSEW
jgi:hypothetical protein